MLVGIIGFFAGIIGGMGMGGGTILIPALVLFANIDPKLAQSINLMSSIPMTIAALIIHIKNKNVEFSLVVPIALFGIVAAILVVTSFAEMFADAGFQKYFVQHDFCDEKENRMPFVWWGDCNASIMKQF